VLRLSSNNLTTVPATEAVLAPLAQLATLDLSGNLVQELPLQITRLTALTHLRCAAAPAP
jgi:Leucine-rich repeat (LRR) protein